jgi:hypothetical protein
MEEESGPVSTWFELPLGRVSPVGAAAHLAVTL